MVGARIALRYYESLSFSRSPDYRKSADYKRYSARITRPGIEFFAGTMRLKGATGWEVYLLPVDVSGLSENPWVVNLPKDHEEAS